MKKNKKYNIEYMYLKEKTALDFKKIIERLFKKYLIEYDN